MHEFALADAVVRAVLETARAEGLQSVATFTVEVGELQQIRRETFEGALREVTPAADPMLADARAIVTVEKGRFRCRPCGREFGLDEAGERDDAAAEAIHFVPELAHAFHKCPACGSPDFEVVGGRGIALRQIEGDAPDA